MLNKKVILIFTLGFVMNFFNNSFVEGAEFFKELFDRNNDLTSVELGTEVSHIRYVEPNFMKDKGYMYGVLGVFTYRTQENSDVQSWRDIFTPDKNKVNMFKMDAKFSWGYVDYESEGTGKMDDIRDLMWETRGVAGYDFPIASSRITPYVGLGFRYLNNDSSGKKTTTGHFGYKRESRYFYLPLGVEIHTPLGESWAFDMTFEFDVFLRGKQKSYLGDAVAGLNTVSNKQNKGYGLRGSFKIVKKSNNMDFYFEPFIRYWNIEDSEISTLTYNGVAVGFGLEPNNNSTEYGIKLGATF